VKEGQALLIEATRNFKRDGKDIPAGETYLFHGPATYYPRIEEAILSDVDAVVIGESQAIKLRAKQEMNDKNGVARKTGEEWLIRVAGSYLPLVHEEIVAIIDPIILDPSKALHLKATKTFIDFYGIERKAGEEYLITLERTSFHIVDIYEEFVKIV
jgi:major vault protein